MTFRQYVLYIHERVAKVLGNYDDATDFINVHAVAVRIAKGFGTYPVSILADILCGEAHQERWLYH